MASPLHAVSLRPGREAARPQNNSLRPARSTPQSAVDTSSALHIRRVSSAVRNLLAIPPALTAKCAIGTAWPDAPRSIGPSAPRPRRPAPTAFAPAMLGRSSALSPPGNLCHGCAVPGALVSTRRVCRCACRASSHLARHPCRQRRHGCYLPCMFHLENVTRPHKPARQIGNRVAILWAKGTRRAGASSGRIQKQGRDMHRVVSSALSVARDGGPSSPLMNQRFRAGRTAFDRTTARRLPICNLHRLVGSRVAQGREHGWWPKAQPRESTRYLPTIRMSCVQTRYTVDLVADWRRHERR